MTRHPRPAAFAAACVVFALAFASPAVALAVPLPSAPNVAQFSVSLSSATPGVGIMSGAHRAFSITSDGGRTWQAPPTGSNDLPYFKAAAAGGASTRVVAGTDSSVQRVVSPTSVSVASVVTTLSSPQFNDMDFVDGSKGWGVGWSGSGPAVVFNTVNGGQDWSQQFTATYFTPDPENPDPLPYYQTEFLGVDFTDANNGWVVGRQLADGNGPFADPGRGIVYHTTNGGGAWALDAGYPSGAYGRLAEDISFFDVNTGWVVGRQGLIAKRTSAGWSVQSPGSAYNATIFYDVKASSDATAVVVGSGGTILLTTNGGTNWTKVYPVAGTNDFTGDLYSVTFSTASKGIACGAGGVALSSSDGGKTWQPIHGRHRLAGATRYDTAAAASRGTFAAADTVVIAYGGNYPDALAAAGLAGACDAPVLLVQTTSLPAAAQAELQRLHPTKVFIAGGTGVVNDAVKTAIASAAGISTANVTRLGGIDRYETAKLVREAATAHGADATSAFVVASQDPYGALVVSPYAFSQKIPILLADANPARPLSIYTQQALNNVTSTFVAGTSSTQSSQLAAHLPPGPTEWYGSGTPASLSVAAANKAEQLGWGDYGHIAVARDAQPAVAGGGFTFPDALSAGPVAGRRHGVVMLTPMAALDAASVVPAFNANRTFGPSNTSYISEVDVLGGTGAVSDAAWNTIGTRLQ